VEKNSVMDAVVRDSDPLGMRGEGGGGGLVGGHSERFVERREGAAFEAIVRRPARWSGASPPASLGTSRRRDAFQGDFLVLARRRLDQDTGEIGNGRSTEWPYRRP